MATGKTVGHFVYLNPSRRYLIRTDQAVHIDRLIRSSVVDEDLSICLACEVVERMVSAMIIGDRFPALFACDGRSDFQIPLNLVDIQPLEESVRLRKLMDRILELACRASRTIVSDLVSISQVQWPESEVIRTWFRFLSDGERMVSPLSAAVMMRYLEDPVREFCLGAEMRSIQAIMYPHGRKVSWCPFLLRNGFRPVKSLIIYPRLDPYYLTEDLVQELNRPVRVIVSRMRGIIEAERNGKAPGREQHGESSAEIVSGSGEGEK